ncbi:MAG: hypothetical protein J5631_11345 [Spirochaetaceae bacterium]|nr:hypothetical protein [Spirochaetaceae bacterium]
MEHIKKLTISQNRQSLCINLKREPLYTIFQVYEKRKLAAVRQIKPIP